MWNNWDMGQLNRVSAIFFFCYADRSEENWGKLRLTDKATPKAIESYIERYCQLEGSGILNIDWAHLREEITERTTQDIAEFKHNKSRYELKPNDFGTMELVSIDGEPIS